MNVQIIVYSETDHTLEVAKRLKFALNRNGHRVEIDHIISNPKRTKLIEIPPIRMASAVVFASPVHAFKLAMPMKKYLEENLPKQPYMLLVTQHFKSAKLGGKKALMTMHEMMYPSGMDCLYEGIIHWSSKKRETLIETYIEEASLALLKAHNEKWIF